MRLTRLIVKSSITDEIIRDIDFNTQGLSLIVDETDKKTSGSNIGKTTAVKVIDICLGAKSVSSLYKDKDTGENYVIKDFLDKNKVVAELECMIDDKKYVFKRSLYTRGKSEINGKVISNYNEYISELNRIIFNNINNTPKFRQLISKFIRLDNISEEGLLKYLGPYTRNYEYQAIYGYLYGINTTKSKNLDIIAINEGIEKDIGAIFRKNGVSSLEEFKTKISLMEEEVQKFKKDYSELSVIEEYKEKKEDMEKKLARINKLESIISKGNLKVNLMNEKIAKEKEKIFSVDHKLLKMLYDECKLKLDIPLREFQELEEFHNSMLNSRITMLEKSLIETTNYVNIINKELNVLRKDYEENFVEFNSEIKDKFEEKYNDFSKNNIKLENYISDYRYIIQKKEEKKNNLSKKIKDIDDNVEKEKIKETLNKYFKELTDRVIGEPYVLVFNDDNDDEFPIKIIGMNGKPGTGIKKAMIMCFDIAFIKLIINKKYHMPVFEIHDKLENIDLIELRSIINEARNFNGQYIFPILNDRIKELKVLEEEVVLRLSKEDKFFRV